MMFQDIYVNITTYLDLSEYGLKVCELKFEITGRNSINSKP